jgi:hypothetical protein
LDGLGSTEAMAAAEQLLERVIADMHEVSEGGEFLPLGVWGVRGFDIEAIRAHTPPEDMKTDKVLGTVYRVRVVQTRRTQTTKQQRTHRLTVPVGMPPLPLGDQQPPATAAAQAATTAEAAALAIEDEEPDAGHDSSDSSDNSSSDNSSSSTSSRDKKKKKTKKGKKNKNKKNKKSKKHKKSKKSKKEIPEIREARTHVWFCLTVVHMSGSWPLHTNQIPGYECVCVATVLCSADLPSATQVGSASYERLLAATYKPDSGE